MSIGRIMIGWRRGSRADWPVRQWSVRWSACYLFLAYRSWRAADPNLRLAAYGRAGSICVGLLLAHSIVDYPLRTTALMVMVAISCAFMLRAHLEKATTSVAHSKA